MKAAYVSDLTPDATITSFFLVCEKELRSTREGKPFLRLELGDRSGTIEARLWDNAEGLAALFDRDDIIKVQARVENYKNRLQLAVDKLRRAEPAEVDLSDYFPHTAEDIEQLYVRLRDHAATIKNPWLSRLVSGVIEDPAISPRLKRAPAAKMMHHAFLGGLLEHIILGLEQVTERMNGLEGFPADYKTLVKHLLISHHGEYEFGSPKLPMFREALVLHYLDDLDSKMSAARAVLGTDGGEAGWTAFSAALNRKLLRLDQFRVAPAEKAATAVPENDHKPGTETEVNTKIV